MNSGKKILLFEGELIGGKGHHYDQLVENSLYYKNRGQIFWIVNKNFKNNNLFIPNFVKIINEIDTAKRKISFKNIYLLPKIFFLSIKNFFISYYLIFFKISLNKSIISYILSNFFTFPKYFSSFCKLLNKLNLNEHDRIIFQTARINEIDLAYLLVLLKYKPQIHLRIMLLHRKKKLKKFNSLIKKLNSKKYLFNKIFIYTETNFQKQQIKKYTDIDLELFYNNLSFSSKKYNKEKFTIGILGESRLDKGFNKVPELIEILNNKVYEKVNFLFQINNCSENLLETKNQLLKLSKKYKNITIFNGYINFYQFKDLLKNVDIIPILHSLDQLKYSGSGLVFSSIVNEIPLIIPKNAIYVKNFFKYQSYLEADNIIDYSQSIIKIIENYEYYLGMAKKQSLVFKSNIKEDPINKRI